MENALAAAWALITNRHRPYAGDIRACCRIVVPQHSPDSGRHISSSREDGFGAVGVSFTEDIPTLAVALIHEAQHLKLGALLRACSLYEADSSLRWSVGWREDPCPIGALLHGAYAFTAVTEFWRTEAAAEVDTAIRRRLEFDFATWAYHTRQAVSGLLTSGLLTAEVRHL